MRRAPQLQPLSREHHLGLVISRHAKDCDDDDALVSKHWGKLKEYLDNKMVTHFNVEDDVLLQALAKHSSDNAKMQAKIQEVIDAVATQHAKLTQLATVAHKNKQPSAEQVKKLAIVLYNHIRFEEREEFPLAESVLSDSELDAVYEASADNVKRMNEGR